MLKRHSAFLILAVRAECLALYVAFYTQVPEKLWLVPFARSMWMTGGRRADECVL